MNQVRYPWDRWLHKKRAFRLVRGVDYHCQPHSMGVMIRQAAKARGIRVSVLIDNGVITVGRID